MEAHWYKTEDTVPDIGRVVFTKIDDENGPRNEARLKRSANGLWFTPDGGMYMYYRPTHWRAE